MLLNKWYVDEIYDFLFIHGFSMGGGNAMAKFYCGVVDGGVNGTAWLTRAVFTISMWYDTWIVDGLAAAGIHGAGVVLSGAVPADRVCAIVRAGVSGRVFAIFGYFWWVH